MAPVNYIHLICLMPLSGVPKDTFRKWLELDNLNTVNELIRYGIISEDNTNKFISLHQMIMEVSLVENMPSVSLCKKLLNHLHFICLARGLDVTRPVIITNALTSINNHIIIEHNNYYLSFLQDMFPYFEKYGLINILPDIISRIELLMNEKESTINELDKALLLDYKVWLLLSKKEYDNAIKKYNKAIRLVENYHNLNEISARSANLLSNIYNNLDYTTGMFYQGIIFLNNKDYKNAASAFDISHSLFKQYLGDDHEYTIFTKKYLYLPILQFFWSS